MADENTAAEAVLDELKKEENEVKEEETKEEKKEEEKNEEKEAKKEEKKMKAIHYTSYGGGANALKVIHIICIQILCIFMYTELRICACLLPEGRFIRHEFHLNYHQV